MAIIQTKLDESEIKFQVKHYHFKENKLTSDNSMKILPFSAGKQRKRYIKFRTLSPVEMVIHS